MTQDFRSHPSTFRQREFWLDHESPGTRRKITMMLCLILCLSMLLILSLIFSKNNTEYATIDQVKKMEAHLYQLEERLVWTDEKIDTIQTAAESLPIRSVSEDPDSESESLEHDSLEADPFESDVLKESSDETIKPPAEVTEQPVTSKQPPLTAVTPDAAVKLEPKVLPVIHPKIKKKKINRRDFGIIYKYHKVRDGETLYRIGLKYNVPVSEIRRLNHLAPNDSIHPGQRLLVSQGER
ncbi:MAG: LysM peptidoglycan-binding domain-containing protein [Candidatus Magnetomorum sp.]|nr:LysM peptidoglycan-binding domain-containing protein [Candidatus Magnetomorum sp.]